MYNFLIPIVLTTGFFSLGNLLPHVFFPLFFLSVVPIFVVFVEKGYFEGINVLLISTILIMMIFDNSGVLIAGKFMLIQGFMALLLGSFVRNNLSAFKTTIFTAIILSSLFIFSVYFLFFFFGIDIIGQLKANLLKIDIPSENKEDWLNGVKYFTRNFFSFMFLGTLLMAVINYFVANYFLKKRGIVIPQFPEFSLWKPRDELIFGFLGGGFIYIFGKQINFEKISHIGENCITLFGSMYFVNSVSLLKFFIKESKILLLLGYIMLFIQPLLGFLVGISDVFIDFRKRKAEQ